MPNYHTLIGDMVPPPPFLHRDVTLHGMFFDADLQALQGYMDASFNRVAGIRCEVQTAAVMLITLYAGDVRPMDARYQKRDGISEIDCGFWALVRCGRVVGPSRLYWTPLCLFVDSVFALVIGRELYGFPKMLGRIDPDEPSASADLSVEVRTDHFQRQDDRDILVPDLPLFSVVRDATLTIPVHTIDLEELKREASQYLQAQMNVAALEKTEAEAEAETFGFPYLDMPMLFLRQLRAISHTPAAAYSSVSAASMEPQAMPSIERVYDNDLKLTLHPSQNLLLGRLIGLQSGQKARLPFRARLDFTAGEGEDL